LRATTAGVSRNRAMASADGASAAWEEERSRLVEKILDLQKERDEGIWDALQKEAVRAQAQVQAPTGEGASAGDGRGGGSGLWGWALGRVGGSAGEAAAASAAAAAAAADEAPSALVMKEKAKLETELHVLKSSLTRLEADRDEARNALMESGGAVAPVAKALAAAQRQVETLERELEAARGADGGVGSAASAEELARVTARAERSAREADEALAERGKLRADLSESESVREMLVREKARLEQELSEAEARASKARSELAETAAERESLLRDKARLETERTETDGGLSQSRTALTEAEAALAAATAKADALETTVTSLQGELASMEAAKISLEASLEEARAKAGSEAASSDQELERVKAELASAEAAKAALETSLEEAQAGAASIEAEAAASIAKVEAELASAEAAKAEATATIASLEKAKAELEQSSAAKIASLEEAKAELEQSSAAKNASLEETKAELEQSSAAKIASLEEAKAELEQSSAAKIASLEQAAAAREEELASVCSVAERVPGLESELAQAQSAAEAAGALAKEAVEAKEEAERACAAATDEAAAFKARLDTTAAELVKAREEEQRLADRSAALATERRSLHEQVMTLRGNIRVFVRVRPMSADEASVVPAGTPDVCRFPEDSRIEVEDLTRKPSTVRMFAFDNCFAPTAANADVFEEVAPLAQSFFDGYNVCVFAYGQTGSGKTHTMQGAHGRGVREPGVMALFAARVLELAAASEAAGGGACTLSASFMEIYMENARDLLARGSSGKGSGPPTVDIKLAPDGKGVVVPGIERRTVASVEDMEACLAEGAENRASASTKMNDVSSRSHAVLTLYLERAVNGAGGEAVVTKLHLIDLAGSERLSRSGAEGEQLKEAQHINKSLSALGDIVQALQKKDKHVPYRNSKLTFLLQDSLGGRAKALMIVNASPTPASAAETLNSLSFAERANRVELGRALRARPTPTSTPSPGPKGSSGAPSPAAAKQKLTFD